MQYTWAMRAALLMALVLGLPNIVYAGKFNGFSQDGRYYLEGADRVCTPLSVDRRGRVIAQVLGLGQGTLEARDPCETADASRRKSLRFVRPRALQTTSQATSTGQWKLWAEVDDALVIKGARSGQTRTLAWWPKAIPKALGSLFISREGSIVAIEYRMSADPGAPDWQTVAFDVRAALASHVEGSAPKAEAEAEAGRDELAARLVRQTWAQHLVACEREGARLGLKTTRRFTLTIESRCQGEKDRLVTGGIWEVTLPDALVLTFENEEGPTETVSCRVYACPDLEGAAKDLDRECVSCPVDADMTIELVGK